MKVRGMLLIICILAFLTACATVPTQEKPVENYRDFNKPFSEVWSKTVEGLVRSGKTISHTDKTSGLITIEEEIAGEDVRKLVLNPGFLTTYNGGKSKVSIYIKPISRERTKVFVNTEISAIGVPFLCEEPREIIGLKSNGTIEGNYLDLIAKLISVEPIRPSIISPVPHKFKPIKPTTMIVIKPRVNVRENPTTQSKIITTLQQGAVVTMTGRKGNWARIELSGGENGWIYQSLIGPESSLYKTSSEKGEVKRKVSKPKTPRPRIKTVIVNRECEVKKEPEPFSPVLKKVPKGTRLKATGKKEDDWIEVEVGNEKGYVFKDFVR